MDTPRPKSWHRERYLLSTDNSLVDLDALNDAFDSDLMWWASRLPGDALKVMVDKSLCFGLYVLPEAASAGQGKGNATASMAITDLKREASTGNDWIW